MEEGIRLPKFVKSIDDIYSNNFKKIDFIKYYANGQYSIELLRDVYVEDERFFRSLRDEIYLRGFKVLVDKSSPSLYSYNLFQKSDQIIVVDFLGEEYKKIDFKNILHSNMVLNMNVDNDMFFNYIPLENFKKIYKNVNLSILRREFTKSGFRIINMESASRKNQYIKELSLKLKKTLIQ